MECLRCRATISFWARSFGNGMCPPCGEVAAREEAERRSAAERAAARAREEQVQAARELAARRVSLRSKCPVCGSTRLQQGYVPDSGGSMLTGGNRMRFKTDIFTASQLLALACLDCGHVSFWIGISELPQG